MEKLWASGLIMIWALGKMHLMGSVFWGFPGGSDSKEHTCSVGDSGYITGWVRSTGEGNGNPFQYSCHFFLQGIFLTLRLNPRL